MGVYEFQLTKVGASVYFDDFPNVSSLTTSSTTTLGEVAKGFLFEILQCLPYSGVTCQRLG